MNANPGDLVVCVDDGPTRFRRRRPAHQMLRRGRVYTVLSVDHSDQGAGSGYQFVELLHPDPKCAWAEYRFRKINDEPDNAEIIARIKNPVRKVRALETEQNIPGDNA